MIDRKQSQSINFFLSQQFECLFGDLIAGLDEDLTSLLIEDIITDISTNQLLVCNTNIFELCFSQVTQQARRNFGASLSNDLAVRRVNKIEVQFRTADPLTIKGLLPTFLVSTVFNRVIEKIENIFRRHADSFFRHQINALARQFQSFSLCRLAIQGQQQRSRWQLTPTIDADIG